MFRRPDDALFDFSEKGLPPPPTDSATSNLFDGMDRAGESFGAPDLIPEGPPDHSVVSDLGPGTTETAPRDVTFEPPSGATQLQVTLDEPASPAAPTEESTIDVPPPPAPAPASPEPATDEISMVAPGEPQGPRTPGGDALPAPASVAMPMTAPAPVPSTLSEAETLSAVALVRALSWPGPASSASEAYWRVFLLSLLMHLYAPVGADEEERRVNFLVWLEIIDWWQDEPTSSELISAAALEPMLASPPDGATPGVSAADRQLYEDLADEHDAWVRATFPDGITPAEAELMHRHAPIDSRTSGATWLDYPDALANDWARIAATGHGIPSAPSEPLAGSGAMPDSIAPRDPTMFHSSTTWLEGVLRSRYPRLASRTQLDPELAALATEFETWVLDASATHQLAQPAVEIHLGEIDGYIRAHYQDLLRQNVGSPPTEPIRLTPDELDALIGGLSGSAPPEHSVVGDLSGESASVPVTSGESGAGPAEPTQVTWQEIWEEFRTYLRTSFGGGWTAAQLDDPAGAAQASGIFGRFMTWAYGEDWQEHEYELEQEGGRVSEYISEYFASGTADEQSAAAASDAAASDAAAPAAAATPAATATAPVDAGTPVVTTPVPLPWNQPDPPPFMGVLDDEAPAAPEPPSAAAPEPPPVAAPPTDGEGTAPETPAPVPLPWNQPDPPPFMGVLDDEPPAAVDAGGPDDDIPSGPSEIVIGGDTVDTDTSVEPDSAASGPSRTLVGSGVAVLLVVLIALIAFVAHPFGPASSTGITGTTGGGTTPTFAAVQTSGTAPGGSSGGSSGGGVVVTPRPTFVQPTFVAIIIDHNLISFTQKDLDFCHKPFVVKYSFRINGIAAGTPVVINLEGRGAPTAPQTFEATGGVEFSVSYTVQGGPGVWSDTIVTIDGAPPPFPTGEHESTSISC